MSLPEQTERQFASELQNIWHLHNAQIIEEVRKIASELNIQVSFEMKLEFDARDKTRPISDCRYYDGMFNFPRAIIK
jgi:hypothetical protein